jgi:uncharacterized protein YndB with AHSA1/START domain
MNNDRVTVKRVFDFPIEDVWEAWVNEEKLAWHHPDGYHSVTHLHGQESYEIEMINDSIDQKGIISGKYLVFDKPNQLKFTWSWNWQPELPPTTVDVVFKSLAPNKTEITLTHSGFMDEVTAKQHESGWSMAFENLNKQLGGEN